MNDIVFNRFILNINSEEQYLVIFDHALGGGTQKYRERLINQQQKNNKKLLLITATEHEKPASVAIQIILESETITLSGIASEAVFGYLNRINIEGIIINSLVSYRPFIIFTQNLLVFLRLNKKVAIEVAFHDYYPICPSFNLLNYKGEYCHAPEEDECKKCRPKHSLNMLKEPEISQWQSLWLAILSLAQTVLVFSVSSKNIVISKFPSIENKVHLAPHSMDYFKFQPLAIKHSAYLNIGIVGNIVFHKGLEQVVMLSRYLQEKDPTAIITIYGECILPENITNINVVGEFENKYLANLIVKHGSNVFLHPSICPETFSYVLEELMILNVPIVTFDLGAQAEKTRRYFQGEVVDLNITMPDLVNVLKLQSI